MMYEHAGIDKDDGVWLALDSSCVGDFDWQSETKNTAVCWLCRTKNFWEATLFLVCVTGVLISP